MRGAGTEENEFARKQKAGEIAAHYCTVRELICQALLWKVSQGFTAQP